MSDEVVREVPRASRAELLRASPPLFQSAGARPADARASCRPAADLRACDRGAAACSRSATSRRAPVARRRRRVRVLDAGRVLGPPHGVPLRARGRARRAAALDDPRRAPRPSERSAAARFAARALGAARRSCSSACSCSCSARRSGWAVCAGFFAGYLAYDMLHFALHHHRPRSRLGRRLHELHMRHHFEDDERGFGVSAPWWDMVFRTYSSRAPRGASPRRALKARWRPAS